MKIFLWLMTLAFGVVCLGFWGLSSMILLTFGDQPLPGFTTIVLRPNGWLLICPIPWIIYSIVLCYKKQVMMEHLLVLIGTLILATAILISLVGIACVLPLLPIKGYLGQ